MKKLMMMLGMVVLMSTTMLAQKIAYVDSEYILSKVPEYSEAQEKLNNYSTDWQADIEAEYQKVDAMYKAYQAEEVLLTAEMKIQREDEIIAKENEVKAMQQAKFGRDGELFRKREELIKPIQDLVYEAIQDLAQNRAYDIVLDKSGGVVMLFANPEYDKSDEVLRIMGFSGN